MKILVPVEERFWSKVDKLGIDDCWLWMASTQWDGYGQFNIEGSIVKAHRFSWELSYGPIPDGKLICHHCDIPSCVNPAHLFLGTQSDNMKDMAIKSRSGCTKLTDDDIRRIRGSEFQGKTQQEIAYIFGVSRPHVSGILSGRKRRWTKIHF